MSPQSLSKKAHEIELFGFTRHARPCRLRKSYAGRVRSLPGEALAETGAGHPRLSAMYKKDVDGRDKPGHDEEY